MKPPPVEILAIVASVCNSTCAIWPNLLKVGHIYFGEIFRRFYWQPSTTMANGTDIHEEFLHPDSCHLSADK
jgi:hypothetical protein